MASYNEGGMCRGARLTQHEYGTHLTERGELFPVKAQIGAAKEGLQVPELGIEIVINRLPVCADADFRRLVMFLTYCLVSDVECPVNVEACVQIANSLVPALADHHLLHQTPSSNIAKQTHVHEMQSDIDGNPERDA
jgi:hypothetical protein